MAGDSDPLGKIQARRCLEEINQYLLHGEGDILEVPGKISLVWINQKDHSSHFLAIKAAGADEIMVNGRRFPATAEDLKKGLVAILKENR